MNIFATDPDPVVSARQHCDVHVIKMILETAQLLSTTHIMIHGTQVAYKKTHHNHPCGVWLRESSDNYKWAYTMLCALLDEYEYRFNKKHVTTRFREALAVVPDLPAVGLTPFAQAMPEELRHPDPHRAYRRYLRTKLNSWRNRERPMRTTFTRREVPSFLLSVSMRKLQPVNLGFYHVPARTKGNRLSNYTSTNRKSLPLRESAARIQAA